MNEYLSPHLCGYRKGFSTQTALSSLIEKWKQVLDSKGYGAAVLMDLFKAFDTINHELLIASYMHMVLLKSHLQLFLTIFLTVGNMLKLILLSVLGQN